MVLYDCKSTYRVKLLVNEQEFKFPKCKDLYCDYQDFLKIYNTSIGCKAKKVCGTSQLNNFTTTDSDTSEISEINNPTPQVGEATWSWVSMFIGVYVGIALSILVLLGYKKFPLSILALATKWRKKPTYQQINMTPI
jgi:hypothetical protein